jgi:hypothetical protein
MLRSLCGLLAALGVAAPALAAELPFHDCNGLICFDVAIEGGKVHTLALDTGDVDSVIVADAAKALGWKLTPLVQDGKTLKGYSLAGDHDVSLGSASVKAPFLVLDRDMFGNQAPGVEGLLAYTAFKDRVLRIDYPHHTLRISEVITTPLSKSAAPGKLQLITFGRKGPPIVVGGPFTVNGKSLQAQIDTCYTGTLLIYDAALSGLGLSKQGNAQFFPFTDGGVTMLAGQAQNIGFGKQTIMTEQPTLYFVDAASKNRVHQPDALFEGTVGNALFAHSVVTLDFHAMTLDVRPAG